jgi:drug/metabolite transporter (DMT)-like permease
MGFLTVPVVGLAASWVMLGEPLTALDLAGAVTTMAGIVLVSASSRDRRREASPNEIGSSSAPASGR